MEDKIMSRIKSLLFLLALAAQVPLASAKVTYQVGTCLPKLPTFTTIAAALQGPPAPDVVEICPGVYDEQVIITIPVTLEGVSNGAVELFAPSGSFLTTTDDLGDILAPQVWVDNVSGKVNLTNLDVDGALNYAVTSLSNVAVVGVLYQNSSGTIDHVVVEQEFGNGHGFGVWFEGGSANPSVTVENSFINTFDNAGINMETNSSTPLLTATITGNSLDGEYPNAPSEASGFLPSVAGIAFGPGVNASVSGNFVTNSLTGIYAGSQGSISKNIIEGTLDLGMTYGIDVETNDVSVTSNTIREAMTGIQVNSAAPVTGNMIVGSDFATGIGFTCNAGTNVHSNTILDAAVGLTGVPSRVGSNVPQTYYDVATDIVIYSGICAP
jgi:hypothetical protein